MYPDESIQGIIEPEHSWWEEYKGDEYKRGRLVWAFIPHVDQTPAVLVSIERGEDPTQHKIFQARIQPLNIKHIIRYPDLPVAGLPQRHNEVRAVYLAKKRPAIIISKGGPRIKKELTKNKAKWQTNPAVVVAPYYGVEQGFKRAGFNLEFVERVRLCEYPHFMWDKLPLNMSSGESIMRLDHMQPIGRSQDSIQFTDYCLSDRALLLFDEWLEWLITGTLSKQTKLCEIRDVLLDLQSQSNSKYGSGE